MHCAKFDWNWPEVKNGKSLRRQIIWTYRQMTDDSWIELKLTLDFSSRAFSVFHLEHKPFYQRPSLGVLSVQWRIQEFQNRGRGLGIWGLLWRPFTHTLCFCRRVKMKRKWIFRFLVKLIGEVIALCLLL